MPTNPVTYSRLKRAKSPFKPPSATSQGYGYRWQKARAFYLQEHPLCVACLAKGETVPSNEIDHIIPHKGNQELFWDQGNWQALCKRCHSRKTGKELRE